MEYWRSAFCVTLDDNVSTIYIDLQINYNKTNVTFFLRFRTVLKKNHFGH